MKYVGFFNSCKMILFAGSTWSFVEDTQLNLWHGVH